MKEILYCPNCGHLHVDIGEWAVRPHHNHLCALCERVWDEGHYSFGVNLSEVPPEQRVPHGCYRCRATYRVRGNLDDGEVPLRSVCVCEVTASCDTCGHGFVVQRKLHDEDEEPSYQCRACATGLTDAVVRPVRRTGPDDLHDIDEHIAYYIKKDKRRLRCESCSKQHIASNSAVEKTRQGYLFGCPDCGETELVLAKPPTETVEYKKPSVHWKRRTRPAPAGEE